MSRARVRWGLRLRVRGEGAEHQRWLEVGQDASAVCDQEGAAAWRGLEADEGGKGRGERPRGVVVQPDVRGRQRLCEAERQVSWLRRRLVVAGRVDYSILRVGGSQRLVVYAVSAGVRARVSTCALTAS